MMVTMMTMIDNHIHDRLHVALWSTFPQWPMKISNSFSRPPPKTNVWAFTTARMNKQQTCTKQCRNVRGRWEEFATSCDLSTADQLLDADPVSACQGEFMLRFGSMVFSGIHHQTFAVKPEPRTIVWVACDRKGLKASPVTFAKFSHLTHLSWHYDNWFQKGVDSLWRHRPPWCKKAKLHRRILSGRHVATAMSFERSCWLNWLTIGEPKNEQCRENAWSH